MTKLSQNSLSNPAANLQQQNYPNLANRAFRQVVDSTVGQGFDDGQHFVGWIGIELKTNCDSEPSLLPVRVCRKTQGG